MRLAFALIALLLWAGCGDDDGGAADGGTSGMDGSSPFEGGTGDSAPPAGDGGTTPEGGADGGGEDAGWDAGLADAGWDAGPLVCDPVGGVECDGDWAEECRPACAAGECCSPQGGRFSCVARAADGTCPAADIWVDEERVTTSSAVDWREFPAGDCAIDEGCVDAPGWRRLLRFATWTPNTGDADLYLGPPADMAGLFEYSECHEHYHFDSYARYELRDLDGTVVAAGHKQAFCLLDYYQYPGTDPRGTRYTCDNQGIQMGYQDVYSEDLDCQWVDVTDVAAGEYILRIELNYDGVLLESDYTNNVSEVRVTVPPDEPAPDVTVPCPAGTPRGTGRSCGFTRDAAYTCTPGETLRVGCSATCGTGSCTGDPFIRVCESSHDPDCDYRWILASNDDSGCGGGRSCGRGGDCCPLTEVTCPASGSFTVFWAPYTPGDTATCNVVVE